MATHHIGRNATMIALTIPKDEAAFIGRLACQRDESRASFLKRIYLRGLEAENPEAAKKVKAIRVEHRTRAGATLVCLLALGFTMLGHAELKRSRVRHVRRIEIEAEVAA